jgi:hypothetical protein
MVLGADLEHAVVAGAASDRGLPIDVDDRGLLIRIGTSTAEFTQYGAAGSRPE